MGDEPWRRDALKNNEKWNKKKKIKNGKQHKERTREDWQDIEERLWRIEPVEEGGAEK